MTADSSHPDALRDADGQTTPTAGGSARDSAAARTAANSANPVAGRNSPDWLDDAAGWSSSTRMLFVCAWCHQIVEPRTGLATVDPGAAQARARVINVARKRGRKLDPPPARAKWKIVHHGCHQPAMDGSFTVELTRLRTLGRVLNVTLTLLEIGWATHTNWREHTYKLMLDQTRLRDVTPL